MQLFYWGRPPTDSYSRDLTQGLLAQEALTCLWTWHGGFSPHPKLKLYDPQPRKKTPWARWQALHLWLNSAERPRAIYSIGGRGKYIPRFLAYDYKLPLILSLGPTDVQRGHWPKLPPQHYLTVPERPVGELVLASQRVQAEQLILLPQSRSLSPYLRPENTPPRDFEALIYLESADTALLDFVLDIWRYVVGRRPQSRLLLLASPVLKTQWEASAKHLGLKDRILFVEKSEQVYKLLWRSHLYLGLELEAQHPQILLAAMAGGCWPLVSPEGWGKHLIREGENGALLHGEDSKTLAAQILNALRLYTDDPGRAQDIVYDFSPAALEEAWGELLARLGSASEV